ncbi:MAG: serine/threonine-protein kinase, partial [Acidimicrobiales bacterium]
NVLTCPDGRVKVADFGIATAMDEAQAITTTGLLIGTPAYLAPERLAGAAATPAADLYSLSSVLYQCLTGRRPFEGASTIELITAVRDRQPEAIALIRPEVDLRLAHVIELGLSKDPAERPLTAAAMSRMLDQADPTRAIEDLLDDTTRVISTQALDAQVMSTQVMSTQVTSTQVMNPTAGTVPAGQLPGPAAVPGPGERPSRPNFRTWYDTTDAHREAIRGFIRQYRVVLAFCGAFLLALLVALVLVSPSSGPAPSPARGNGTSPAPVYRSSPHLPAPLGTALHRLESAVG